MDALADMHLPIQPLRNGKSWTGYEPSVSGDKGRRKMGQDRNIDSGHLLESPSELPSS